MRRPREPLHGEEEMVENRWLRALFIRPLTKRLLVIWLAGTLVLLFALPSDPVLFRQVTQGLALNRLLQTRSAVENVSRQEEWLRRHDPKPGFEAPELIRSAGSASDSRPKVILYLGSCSECSLNYNFDSSVTGPDSWYELVVLIDADADVQKARQLVGNEAKIVVDTKESPSGNPPTHAYTLNAYFVPRAYLFGCDWRLRASSRSDESVEAFLRKHRPR